MTSGNRLGTFRLRRRATTATVAGVGHGPHRYRAGRRCYATTGAILAHPSFGVSAPALHRRLLGIVAFCSSGSIVFGTYGDCVDFRARRQALSTTTRKAVHGDFDGIAQALEATFREASVALLGVGKCGIGEEQLGMG